MNEEGSVLTFPCTQNILNRLWQWRWKKKSAKKRQTDREKETHFLLSAMRRLWNKPLPEERRSTNTEELSSTAFMQRAMLTCVGLPRKRYEPLVSVTQLVCCHQRNFRNWNANLIYPPYIILFAIPTTIIVYQAPQKSCCFVFSFNYKYSSWSFSFRTLWKKSRLFFCALREHHL